MGQRLTKEDTVQIISSDNWLTNNRQNDIWVNAAEDDINKMEIIAPNFSTLRKSWIER